MWHKVHCYRNGGAPGGLNPNVNVRIIAMPAQLPWPRSWLHGPAQAIVQSTKDAGEIKLTATTDGPTVTATIQTRPCTLRPSVR